MTDPPEGTSEGAADRDRVELADRQSDRLARAIEALAESVQKPSWKLLVTVAVAPTAAVLALAGLLWKYEVARVDRIEGRIDSFAPQLYDKDLYDDIGALEEHVEKLQESGETYSVEMAELVCKAAGANFLFATGECDNSDFTVRTRLFANVDPYEPSR